MTEIAVGDVGEQRRRVVDTLVLAFEKSPAKQVIPSELLRQALDMDYGTFVSGTRIDLESVWKTVQALPGFDNKNATPAMCWFKTLERKLGMMITLPHELQKLSLGERTAMAALCGVKQAEVAQLLGPASNPVDSVQSIPAKEISAPIVQEVEDELNRQVKAKEAAAKRARDPRDHRDKEARTKEVSSRRRMIGIAAAVVSVLSILFVGWTLYTNLGGSPKWQKFDSVDFAGIPAGEPRKLGNQVGVTLTDAGWMSSPEAERTKQMEDAFRRVDAKGIKVLFLQDPSGKVRASAQWTADGKVRVRFF